jgi:hypothetical protein
MSSSALLTHCAVWRFIQHLALGHDLIQEPVAILRVFQTLLDLVGCSHVNIEREGALKRAIDADGLIDGIARRHDDHQIDVALRVRRAVGIGAKEDDLVRLKPLGNLAREAADRRQRNVWRSIAVRLDVRCRRIALVAHGALVAHSAIVRDLASGHTIWLDDKAAAGGWLLDPMPWDDRAFTTPGNRGEQNRRDLLPVPEPEIRQRLGHDHEADGLMAETLTAGTRRTHNAASPTDWLAAAESVFSEAFAPKRRR